MLKTMEFLLGIEARHQWESYALNESVVLGVLVFVCLFFTIAYICTLLSSTSELVNQAIH